MSAAKAAQKRVNPWVVMAFIAIPVFVGSLDLTVVSAFLPELITHLDLPLQTALDDAAWIVSGYLLAYAISLTFMGRVSDLLGRRAVYVACLSLFMLGSLLVATAHQWPTETLYTLFRRMGQRPDIAEMNLLAIIVGRVIQALGAGALVPVSLALVGDIFPEGARARPLGLIGALDTLGWVLGHLYGGLLVQFMPWQGLFWINLPLTLLALLAVLWALRHVPQQRASGRFDFLGVALIAGALTALNLGLGANVDIPVGVSNFEQLSPLPEHAGPVLFIALLCFLAFVYVEARVKDPLMRLQMFRRRNLSMGALTNLFVGYGIFIGLVSVPILINVRQQSFEQLTEAALTVGLLLSTLTVPMALAAVPGGWLSDRIGYARTTMLGLALAAVGFLLVWQTWTLDISDGLVALEMALVGIGLGLTFSPISAAVINDAKDDERGVASALVIILRLVGMTVSISSLTALSLTRIGQLVNVALGDATSVDPSLYAEVYARSSVQVLAEIGLIGAVICLLAMIPAALLRGGKREGETQPAKSGIISQSEA
ncbi:MAG: MFS transporter [Chloroflexi bacterium]|nr:MAG: MFS transporter [Chloroflexota bacterium]